MHMLAAIHVSWMKAAETTPLHSMTFITVLVVYERSVVTLVIDYIVLLCDISDDDHTLLIA